MSFISSTRTSAVKGVRAIINVRMYSGELGSGAGKGGGGGGSIREAGGAFGKMEVAKEEEYFYKKQKQQLQTMKAKGAAQNPEGSPRQGDFIPPGTNQTS